MPQLGIPPKGCVEFGVVAVKPLKTLPQLRILLKTESEIATARDSSHVPCGIRSGGNETAKNTATAPDSSQNGV